MKQRFVTPELYSISWAPQPIDNSFTSDTLVS